MRHSTRNIGLSFWAAPKLNACHSIDFDGSDPFRFALLRPAWRGLLYFHGEGVSGAEHVGAENNPLLIGCKRYVRLQAVLVFRHVDQPFGAEHAGMDETRLRKAAVLNQFRAEKVNPLTIGRPRDLARIPPISREQLAVRGHVKVNRPLVAQ